MLSPIFTLCKTAKFHIIEVAVTGECKPKINIQLDWNCDYTRTIIESTCARRPWCTLNPPTRTDCCSGLTLQVADFENIIWENVVSGQHRASSYLVRKGLSRKAQLSLQIRRHVAKNPKSILRNAVPHTVIIETWNAFDDVKIDFGFGLSTSFDFPSMQRAPLRERLEWILNELHHSHFNFSDDQEQPVYILKPSVTNKGADISLITSWDELLDTLGAASDLREWVLQHYLANPLLLQDGHKFHLRVYILCVGALRVFVFQDILVLFAAHKYESNAFANMFAHLTNTARGIQDTTFDELRYIKLVRDLPKMLCNEYPKRFPSLEVALAFTQSVLDQVHVITSTLFAAYESEYSIFCPMPNCFELYGLDFFVADDGRVSLLEINPGPDFMQTGERLRNVIIQLWEQTFRIIVDTSVLDANVPFQAFEEYWKAFGAQHAADFVMVYSKEWSVNKLQGGPVISLH